MPLPEGAHFVKGTERVLLSDGRNVSKNEAYNIELRQRTGDSQTNVYREKQNAKQAKEYGLSPSDYRTFRNLPGVKAGIERVGKRREELLGKTTLSKAEKKWLAETKDYDKRGSKVEKAALKLVQAGGRFGGKSGTKKSVGRLRGEWIYLTVSPNVKPEWYG